MTAVAPVKPYSCPACGYTYGTAPDETLVSLSGTAPMPKPNQATVCTRCAAPLIFREDMSVRLMSDQELELLRKHRPGIHRGIRFLQDMVRRQPAQGKS